MLMACVRGVAAIEHQPTLGTIGPRGHCIDNYLWRVNGRFSAIVPKSASSAHVGVIMSKTHKHRVITYVKCVTQGTWVRRLGGVGGGVVQG